MSTSRRPGLPRRASAHAYRGKFVGTANRQGKAFVSLLHAVCTDDTVAVRYKVPGSLLSSPPRLVRDVKYRWIGDGLWERIGPLPPPWW
jgi:hypothetical protein